MSLLRHLYLRFRALVIRQSQSLSFRGLRRQSRREEQEKILMAVEEIFEGGGEFSLENKNFKILTVKSAIRFIAIFKSACDCPTVVRKSSASDSW